MKKLILALLGIIVLAVVGVSIYASTIDWNQHKGKLTEQLMEITGKKVVFNGPVSMSVFPSPSLTASNVRVYSAVNQDLKNPLMRIESIVADLSFSALLGGSFDVKMMSLVKPEIYVTKKGEEVNWLDNAKTNSQAKIKDINIALDSVLLNDATMIITDDEHNIKTTLNNLNAEIIADSLNGPYRIDGSYTKGNSPEGFAISIGNLSDSFATNLNLVLSQPSSDTYLRFDGTFLLSNAALNGNLILESKKFKQFYDSTIPGDPLTEYWDKPLEASMELKVNKTQAELANVVLKYGDSAGAGNIIVPLKSKSYIIGEDNDDLKEVNIKFDMTDLNLEPFVESLKNFVIAQSQENALYNPEFPFDLNVNLSALKASYNNQSVKDFGIKLSLHDDVWQLENINGVFPGGTQIKATGRIASTEDILSYDVSVDAQTDNLKKFFDWLNIPLSTVASSTYQKSSIKAAIVGDTKNIQISPLTVSIDNTVLTGELGVKRGKPSLYSIELATDSIILDNYLPKIFETDKSLMAVLSDLWKETQWVNTVDMDLNLKAGLLIYDKTSFDKVALKASLQKGILNVQSFDIGESLKSSITASGEISGFGGDLQFSNLNYTFSTTDFSPLLQRLNLDQPKWNLKFFQPFTSTGVASLNQTRFWLKADNKMGEMNVSYNGRIEPGDHFSLSGELLVEAPNTSEVLKNMPINYVAQDDKLGRLRLKGQIVGTTDKFKLSDMTCSVGANTFQGTVGADMSRQIPYFVVNLKINRLEPERFMARGDDTPRFVVDRSSSRTANLWVKPNLSELPFNREKMQDINFVSNLDIGELVIRDSLFKNVKAELEDKNNELVLKQFQAGYNDGDITADFKYTVNDKPRLVGNVSVTNQNVREMDWVGDVYGLKNGIVEINSTFNTSALSPRDILDNFTGVVNVNIDSPIVKGVELSAITEDLKERRQSDGLQNVLRDDLQKGETAFNKFSGKINFREGYWQIDRALFKSDLATMSVSGSGNLAAWNMDSAFSVQLAEPKDIQPFSFTLKPSMANPEIEIDASPITKIYDEQKAQIEAEKKAKQEAYEKELRSKLDSEKDILQEMKAVFDDFVNNNYLPLKAKITEEENKAAFDKFEERLEALVKLFESADSILQEKDIKEEYPDMLAKISKDVRAELEAINTEMEDLYIKDMQVLIQANYNAVQAETNAKNALSDETIIKRDAELQRLNRIETNYRFQSDKMYQQLLDTIQEHLQAYEDVIKNIQLYGSRVMAETDIATLEKYVTGSSRMKEEAKNQHEILKDAINRYLTYIDEKLKVEEKAFADMKEAEEKAKKIEENIGTITAPSTGKVQTIIRGIDEIENEEKTMPNPENLGEVKAEDLKVNLLREAPSTANVSGTISKK